MAQDIFIKIDGIKGESLDNTHKGEIEILSWDWDVAQESTMHSGSGGGSGKATIKDLSFIHYIDSATPNLIKYSLDGRHVPNAVLVMRKAGGNPLEFLTITMSDVVITRVRPRCEINDARSREVVALSFTKVKIEYVPQNAQGSSMGTITAEYDIKANR
jgi:type VI secretion system secreted protein Hcp